MNQAFTPSDKCLLCGNTTNLALALGQSPLANELPETPTPSEVFPLNLVRCTHCNHLQLDTLVSEQRLYGHYLYVSDTSKSNREYFKAYARELEEDIKPTSVLDIGSNDGLFLSCFSKEIQKLGVDPAQNIAATANKKGIKTIAGFFNETLAQSIDTRFDLITCNNCFAHNADLHTIARGVKRLLKPNGVFVFEVSYAMDLLANNLFDLIYHEHIHHWTLKAAKQFFKKHDLEIFDAHRVSTHGGSIRVYVQAKAGNHPTDIRLLQLYREEERYFPALVRAFPHGVAKVRADLRDAMAAAKHLGKKVSILGYPAKAATLTSYFGLTKADIQDVYDDNALKVGRYSHQGHVIRPTSEIAKRKPDILLILAWNYATELMARFPGNRFIVPLPEVKIV